MEKNRKIFTTKELRDKFLQFFKQEQHKIMPSSSLIPHNDPSLMFVNSGMVQFKNYFTGTEKPQFTKVATCQKCVRAGGKHNDLDNVGYTPRHHTFFEMLGNFSFGAYFKEHAIEKAWQFLTEVLSIPKDKLHITVYHTDYEAKKIWEKFIDKSRVYEVETDDNMWSMGATGPHGPCSEIFYDHGEKYHDYHILGPSAISKQGVKGDRFVEIWNLVFMEEEKLADETVVPLPKKAIDTGMGLERIAAVVQGVYSNFGIDIFEKLITASMEILGSTRDEIRSGIEHIKSGGRFYRADGSNTVSYLIIADHLRSSAFLIADGVMPSNEGRGYVLRRIIRRAVSHIYKTRKDFKQPLLSMLTPVLVDEMKDSYPELESAENLITEVLRNEEERFKSTISNGLELLKPHIDNNSFASLGAGQDTSGKAMLSGDIAFKLYDTYGFPLDLTKNILSEHLAGAVDEERFNTLMAEQRAKSIWKGSGEETEDRVWFDICDKYGSTEFLGYTNEKFDATVLAIIKDGHMVNEVGSDEKCIVALNQTPFYGEMGGQVGDTGHLDEHVVNDTKIYANGKIYGHHITTYGPLKVGDSIKAIINAKRRKKIRANHSATHLLNKVLREIIGSHIMQKGSFVSDEKLRFDFTSSRALTENEISMIEESVNSAIIENDLVATHIESYREAIKNGALSLLGEKYSQDVRVISIGSSKELCGGTHVERTGDIGIFKIIKEESIASGVRRIEAYTGIQALKLYQDKTHLVKMLNNLLQCNDDELENKISNISDEKKEFAKSLEKCKIQLILSQDHNMINKLKNDEIVVLCNVAQFNLDKSYLHKVVDALANKHNNVPAVLIALFSTRQNMTDTISIAIRVTNQSHFKANHILKEIITRFGGRGGGNAEFAQAGGIICGSNDLLFSCFM